ncbi:MAG: hypothetical protein LAQ69_34540 [Acidobacteriia bacterium]|nr:hypothetical protein [Terriglobia bacterium]
MSSPRIEELRVRTAPLEMTGDQFRSLGHDLVDRVAGFLASIRRYPVTAATSPEEVRASLDAARVLPEQGRDPGALLREAAGLLFEHSLFNGHPRFYGYITSSAAPIGMLADLLAAAVNANVGAWKLAPMATEMEGQVIRWLAQFIGYPADCGGLLLSGGNMANLTCFLAARAAQAGWDVRKQGIAGGRRLCVYASAETHTWIHKAADLAGLGTDAIHWIHGQQTMDLHELEARYRRDLDEGYQPFLVVGSAGTVSTGAVDPLRDLAPSRVRCPLRQDDWRGSSPGRPGPFPDLAHELGLELASVLGMIHPMAFQPNRIALPVAVGIAVAHHPPHRSVRAAFPHTASTSDEWRQNGHSDTDA